MSNEIAFNIIDEVVHTECLQIVRKNVNKFAESHLHLAHAHELLVALLNEMLRDELLPPILLETWLEEMAIIVLPSILDEGMDIKSIVESAMKDIHREERKGNVMALRRDGGERLLEHVALSYLLSFCARQGQLLAPNEYASYFLDSLISDVLLSQHFQVYTARKSMFDHKSLRRFHERAFTDELTLVLLDSLKESLDEDNQDLQQHEEGIEQVHNSRLYGRILEPI